jgi:hypothetical protein
MSNIKLSVLRLILLADMDGNKWDGYLWVDGWPVTPPRAQYNQQQQEPTTGEQQERGNVPNIPSTSNTSTTNCVSVNQVTVPHVDLDDQGSVSAHSNVTGTSYATSLLSDSEEEPDETQVKLGNSYTQCRAAREVAMSREVTDISCNANALSTEKKKGFRVGTMDRGLDSDILNCFKGVRIEKNGNLVNQFLSCSFDPSSHMCITCSHEHAIGGGGDGSECYVLSDQNFVATLPGCEGKKCLKIVRVENSSLVELAGIFLEIMENKSVKPGTCILITSLSYLSRVGAAAYASEWRVAVSMLVSRWAGVLVCPVFPLHFSEIPGTLFGEMLILHTWFRNMYAGTHLGLQSAWDRYTEILLELVEGSGSLDSPEYLSPLLPSSLDPRSSFVPTHFSTSSTSPAIIFGLDRKYTYELLLSLTVSLRRGFSISANPEGILARETAASGEGAKGNKCLTIILAGASNLASLKPVFESNGAVVIDLTKPGWMITEANVEALRNEISALSNMEDAAIIFDLFGNSSYRFQHVDGTLVLPIRVGGGYHLLGEVHMVSDTGISELISMVLPLFIAACALLTVIMPPLPRYVFVGCCRENGHSTNVGMDGYSSKILDSCLHFRKVLKTSLVGKDELGKFWVTDSLACVGSEPATMQAKLEALRPSLGPDGVHLTDQGRFHLFHGLAKTVLDLREGKLGKPPKPAEAAASSIVSGRSFYWRGFTSDRGSTSRPPARGCNRGRGGAGPGGHRQRQTPYSKPELGGNAASVRGSAASRGGPMGGRGRGFF